MVSLVCRVGLTILVGQCFFSSTLICIALLSNSYHRDILCRWRQSFGRQEVPGGDGVQECEYSAIFNGYAVTLSVQKIDLSLHTFCLGLVLIAQVLNAGGLCDLDNIQ